MAQNQYPHTYSLRDDFDGQQTDITVIYPTPYPINTFLIILYSSVSRGQHM